MSNYISYTDIKTYHLRLKPCVITMIMTQPHTEKNGKNMSQRKSVGLSPGCHDIPDERSQTTAMLEFPCGIEISHA